MTIAASNAPAHAASRYQYLGFHRSASQDLLKCVEHMIDAKGRVRC
jgi:hypothetical protein